LLQAGDVEHDAVPPVLALVPAASDDSRSGDVIELRTTMPAPARRRIPQRSASGAIRGDSVGAHEKHDPDCDPDRTMRRNDREERAFHLNVLNGSS
jgi:hypothetical protein